MDTSVIPNAVVAYALGRVGKRALVPVAITRCEWLNLRLTIADGENTGQLTIGGFDLAKQNGETTQILDVADRTGFWKARMEGVMVDGDVAVPTSRVAILDTGEFTSNNPTKLDLMKLITCTTGTTLMYLPPADADAIHLLIEGAAP